MMSKKALYALPLICLCISLQAQTVNEPKSGSAPLFIVRQVWGEEREITKAELDEIVVISYDDKAVKDVKVMESVCEELDNLVVSLIEQSPKWEPATANGKPVSQCLTIPITFQMR